MYHENVLLVKLRTGAVIHQYRYAIISTTHLSSVLNRVRELLLHVQQECTKTHMVPSTLVSVFDLSHTPSLISRWTLSEERSILDARVDHATCGTRGSND